MKTVTIRDTTYTCYQHSDLSNEVMQGTIAKARDLWQKRCAEYVAKHGDRGSCVMGAGIAVWYLAKKCRTPGKLIIIDAREATWYQGSVIWEDSRAEVQKFLADNGIVTCYAWGNMD